jgi:regulatory protein
MARLSLADAQEKIRRFCAYQERHHQEVRSKLISYGIAADAVEEIIASLILDGFLNEERFAKAFAGGKFRMKKWGRLRIVNALESRGITKACIRAGLAEIDPDEYLQALRHTLGQKARQLDEPNLFVMRDKLSKYAILRGYEPETVWEMIRELYPDHR